MRKHMGPFLAPDDGLPDNLVELHRETAGKVKNIADQVSEFDGRLSVTQEAAQEAVRLVDECATAVETLRNSQSVINDKAYGLSSKPTLRAALTRRESIAGEDPKASRKRAATISANPEARARMYGDKLTPYELESQETLARLKAVHEYHMEFGDRAYKMDPMAELKKISPDDFQQMERLSAHWGGDATDGAEWQITMQSATWVTHFTLEPVIEGQFTGMNRVNIPDGSSGFYHSVDDGEMIFATISNTAGSMRGHQTGTQPASTGQPDSARASHTVALTRGIVSVDEAFDQDTVGDQMAHARNVLMVGARLAKDEMILNGQETTDDANFDGSNASDAANASFNGLRYRAHAGAVTNAHETNHGGGAITLAALLAERETMGKFGVNPRDSFIAVDPVSYIRLVHEDAVRTADVYGQAFTLRTGELASVDGIALLPSDRIPTNLAEDGDKAATGALTVALIVNTTQGFVGDKRAVELRFKPNLLEYQYALAAFFRMSFTSAKADTTDEWIRVLRNVNPA